MTHEAIGERVRALREERGMTPFDLSVASGIREQNIRNWETGRKNVSTEFIPSLAQALGVTPNDLFGVAEPAEVA